MPEVVNSTNDSFDKDLSKYRYKIIGKRNLRELSNDEILMDIAQRQQDGRHIIIPIGLPQAGKSMFIASLLAYAFRSAHTECSFSDPYPQDISGVTDILNLLDKRKILLVTEANEVTFFDIDMTATYLKKTIKITLIDLAGEDFARLIGKEQISKDFPEQRATKNKIEYILAACIARKAIFAIVTPVEHGSLSKQQSQMDRVEDRAMSSFISIMKEQNPRLYDLTKFLLVVSKWDLLPSGINVLHYLSSHRESLYNEVSANTKYGRIPYSVGNVVGEVIMDVNLKSPQNFWFTLFRFCTGRQVLPWWKRLLN
jgi:hypothetical protein